MEINNICHIRLPWTIIYILIWKISMRVQHKGAINRIFIAPQHKMIIINQRRVDGGSAINTSDSVFSQAVRLMDFFLWSFLTLLTLFVPRAGDRDCTIFHSQVKKHETKQKAELNLRRTIHTSSKDNHELLMLLRQSLRCWQEVDRCNATNATQAK